MKELNSNLYGLSELTENEKMDTEGGAITLRTVAIVTGLTIVAATGLAIVVVRYTSLFPGTAYVGGTGL